MLRLTLCQQSDALTLICKMQIFIWVLNLPLPDFLDMSVRFGSLCLHMALALVRSSLSEIDERSMNKSKAGKKDQYHSSKTTFEITPKEIGNYRNGGLSCKFFIRERDPEK